ncbi:MAG: glucose-1-phosphate adenylyltransferase [Gemmatales bacterium]
MKDVVSLILGGGQGTRLYPLTKYRSKPAVPIGGKYRLIDIPISNCLNSGLNRIYVLTQFLSASLHQHITRSYNFDVFGGGFVEILAAQQTMESTRWYEGTADAIRRNMQYIDQPGTREALILSGDQLYRMEYEKLIETHRKNDADITIAVIPVERSAATSLGIMKLSDNGRVTAFVEKPKTDELLDQHRTPAASIEKNGIAAKGREYLASMGIYLFKKEVLVEHLRDPLNTDFGKHVIPASIKERKVQGFLFDGYWEDVGTIAAYFDASLLLTEDKPPFYFQSEDGPIFTRRRFLPASKVMSATVKRALLSDGCLLQEGSHVEHSIVGVRSLIGKNATVKDCIIIGADRYETEEERARNTPAHPAIGIGDGSHIERAIVDKNVRIGKNVRIMNEKKVQECDGAQYCIRDGIVVIAKDAIIQDGTVI